MRSNDSSVCRRRTATRIGPPDAQRLKGNDLDSLIPAYEAIARDLKASGVQEVFGLMSDDTALLATSLDGMGVKFRGARHENSAIAMAEGYASATGRLAVALIGRGPATANAVLGSVYVQRSGSPVLLIFGEAPERVPAPNAVGPEPKAFNSAAVLQAAGLRTLLASDPRSVRRMLAEAMTAAHRGAVALLLPTNVQLARIDVAATDPGPWSAPAQQHRPARAAALTAAAALIAQSRRPLIVAGIGVHRGGARDAVVRLADHIGAALVTTMKAQDTFRGHPFDGGILGSFSHSGGRLLTEQADCAIVFGAGLNQRTTSFDTSLPQGVPVIQIDSVRTNIGRWFHADVAVVADARPAAEQLLELLPARPMESMAMRDEVTRKRLAGFRLESDFEPLGTPRTMDPRSLAVELDRLLPPDRNVVYDVGNFLQIVPYVSVEDPSHLKHSSDFSSIGLGFGTALGFACGSPHRVTVLFVGDGGFLMTMGELETVAREDLPVVVVLMNDCAYGAELHFLEMRDMPVGLSKFPDIDFAPVAEAFGFRAETVRTLDELRSLADVLGKPDGPLFLDCKINGAVSAPFLLESHEQERRKS